MPSIKEFLNRYSFEHRKPFNEQLFVRSEYDIVNDLCNIIRSITTDAPDSKIKINVNSFRLIEDYRQIQRVLEYLESDGMRTDRHINYNIYDGIDVKSSDIIILEVNYHIQVDDDTFDGLVYIDIPKVVNKYFFRIGGTMYSALYQISDASTYNNSSQKKHRRSVSFRQEFLKVSLFERVMTITQYVNGEDIEVSCLNYMTDLFGNLIPVCKYFLASKGLMGTYQYLCTDYIMITANEPYIDPSCTKTITFRKGNLFISVPYYLWSNSYIYQTLIYTIWSTIPKDATEKTLNDIFNKDYWIIALGGDFKSRTIEKGKEILDSTRRNYSLEMKNTLRVKPEDKGDLIDILRWMTCQFEDLYQKDNCDMTYKKFRLSGYVAGFYAKKLTDQILRFGKSKRLVGAEGLFKLLNIKHNYIIEELKKCNLLTYKSSCNDDDIFNVLRCTYKGPSGIGENKTSAVPQQYRLANASQIGKIDCDTSSNSDPGMTTMICPYTKVYNGNYFADYNEPDNWKDCQYQLINRYRELHGLIDMLQMQDDIMETNMHSDDIEHLEEICHIADKVLPFALTEEGE